MKHFGRLFLLSILFVIASYAAAQEATTYTQFIPIVFNPDPTEGTGTWTDLQAVGEADVRHENGFIQVGGNFYLLGGRGADLDVNKYSPTSNTWSAVASHPEEMHHFQPVEFGGKIYVLGAWTDSFPYEDNISTIQIFDPVTNQWSTGDRIPSDRRRGSAGAVVYQDKIYLVGGADGGHGDHAETLGWLDEYNPVTGEWRELADMPNGRDHFGAVVIGDKLYAAGGRDSGTDDFLESGITEVDVYDFATNSWTTLPESSNFDPFPSGGTFSATLNNELIVAGGESPGRAWDMVQALDPETGTWRTLSSMLLPRHATSFAICNEALYIAGGSASAGGGPELVNIHRFAFGTANDCS